MNKFFVKSQKMFCYELSMFKSRLKYSILFMLIVQDIIQQIVGKAYTRYNETDHR